jgi:hypothetical protein
MSIPEVSFSGIYLRLRIHWGGRRMNWDTFFEGLGKLAAFVFPVAGLGAVLAKSYIDKWLTRRFQGQLDKIKHDQAQEMERLKLKVSTLLDRATKLHSYEFEVLPKAWELLATSVGSASRVLSAIQTYVDVKCMDESELSAFLEQSPFNQTERRAIRDLARNERQIEYQNLTGEYAFRESMEDWRSFNNYIVTKGIFIAPALRERLRSASALIIECLDEYRFSRFEDAHGQKSHAANRGRFKAIQPLRAEIEAAVSDRLWDVSKLDE